METVTETKKPRGRPFAKGNVPVRARRPEREQDWGAFARSVLTDKKAQKALLKRAQRGDLPAHVISMLVENAAPVVQEEREPASAKELAAWMLESVPSFYRAALYDYWAGNRDASGVPTRESGAWRPVVTMMQSTASSREEPELAKVQPLGEARKRIEAAERAAKASPVTQTDQEAEDAQRELEARETPRTRLPEDKPEHVDDNKHRSECRACRKRWTERENASVPLIRR